MDILKRFGSFFFLMAESLPDESEKTIDSEDENVNCFPAVPLNGVNLCNDGVVASARTTKKVDRKPVNVVLGRVLGKQVGDKLLWAAFGSQSLGWIVGS